MRFLGRVGMLHKETELVVVVNEIADVHHVTVLVRLEEEVYKLLEVSTLQ